MVWNNQAVLVEDNLKTIFFKRFEKDIEAMGKDILDKPLLSWSMDLAPRDLLYLLIDIENEFGIKIPQERIVNNDFSTFNRIVKTIEDQIKSIEK